MHYALQELADFEKMSEGPKLSIEGSFYYFYTAEVSDDWLTLITDDSRDHFFPDLQRDGFEASPPAFRCMVADVKKAEGTVTAGYALYFPIYSTWEGRSMLLEDLYVRKSERRHGVGTMLFDAVANVRFRHLETSWTQYTDTCKKSISYWGQLLPP